MLHPSTQKLIDRLAAMTAQKKIDWIEKSNGDVLYATEGYVVSLTPEPPRVLLSTEGGKALEDVSASLLNGASHADGGTYGDLVASIARNACREARGTEAAINTLLAGLGDADAAAGLDATAMVAGAEVTEELTEDSVSEDGDAAVEDDGDETALLTTGIVPDTAPDAPAAEPDTVDPDAVAETPDPALSETPVGPDAVAETPVEAEADTPAGEISEDLVDVSVPEAALLEPEETETVNAEADTQFETADAEDDGDAVSDDDDVSGAVARLADEVNGSAGTFAESDADSEDDADTDAASDGPEEAELAATPMPSFSVTPEGAQSAQFDEETDEIADASSGPIETEAESTEDFLDSEPDTDTEHVEATSEETVRDETGDMPDETPAWAASAETTPEAPAPEAATDDEPDAQAADDEMPFATPGPVTGQVASNVRYVPFGAGGLEAVGSDMSDEAPADEEIESEILVAADSMSLPDESIAAASEPELETSFSYETEAQDDTPENVEPFPQDTAVSDTDTPDPLTMAADDAPEPEAPASAPNLSLGGLSAGLGFGAKAYSFTPSAPRPAGSSAPDESVSRPSVVIDATEDFPEGTAGDFAADMPETADFDISDDAGDDTSFLETPAAAEDADAALPPETPEEPEKALSLVDADGQEEPAEEEPVAPTRPKTRFNPWT